MQFTVTQRINGFLTIPDGISLTIGNFTFLPDFIGEHMSRHIQTIVEAKTKEEAQVTAEKLFLDFLASLTLLDNSKYFLGGDKSVSAIDSGVTTHTKTLSIRACIAQDGNKIKNAYEGNTKIQRVKKNPMRLYRDGINTDDPFDKFRNFYRVLECYDKTSGITLWIKRQISDVDIKKNNHNQDITIYTWIRIKLSHSKNERDDLVPFLISNSQDVAIVTKYLSKMQELARTKIREKEGV